MDVVGITDTDSNSLSQVAQDQSTMGKDDFLELLVTQLKYQDPMNPMDNSQFASQLSQFSTLEGINNLNETANNQLTLDQSLNNSFMINLIGKDVKAYGNAFELDDSSAEIDYNLSIGADSVKVKIYDEEGKLVNTIDAGVQRAGDQSVEWDGKDSLGNQADDGNYTYKVEAYDGDTIVDSYGYNNGKIDGITYVQGSPYIIVNGQSINLGDIVSILDGGTIEDNGDNNQTNFTDLLDD